MTNNILDALDDLGAETEGAIERFMGDEEMYLEYVVKFPHEPTMATLNTAVATGDYAVAEKAAHALKGLSYNMGFLPVGDAATDVVTNLRVGNIPAALAAYGELQTTYRDFCAAIEG